MPEDYEEKLLEKELRKSQSTRKNPFKQLGVSNEDKMVFYLL